MEHLAVICPLDITADDRAWIEGIRAHHDPQYGRVEAHFTLVFPITGVGVLGLTRHVEQIAERTHAVAFRLNCARAVRDQLAPQSHVFLTPDDGAAKIRRLHGLLYGGEFTPYLRTDIPYQPHVTVAAFEAHSAAETLCKEIGVFEIPGSLCRLDVMSVEGDAIRREWSFRLL